MYVCGVEASGEKVEKEVQWVCVTTVEAQHQFSPLFFEICEFNHFNQILLNLFDISSTFHNSI